MIRKGLRAWCRLAGSLAVILALPMALQSAPSPGQELSPDRLWQDRMTAAVSAHQRGDSRRSKYSLALVSVDALVVKRVPPTSTTMRSVRRFSSGCCGETRRRLRDDEDMVS